MFNKHFLLIAMVVLLAGLMIPDKLVWPQEKSARVPWEYKLVRARDNDHAEKVLNRYGDDGWEVVAWQEPDFLLKRQKDGYTSSQTVKDKSVLDTSRTNEDMIELYQEIIKLRQRDLAEQSRLLEYGRGDISRLMKSKMKLSETRIQLLQLQGNNDLVVKELENIVKLYTEAREQIKREIDKGQKAPGLLYEIEIALLETKIRLAKATQKINP